MFFSKWKKEEAERIAYNELTKQRFANKLAAIVEINNLITETLVKTQAANTELLLKLKKHLKNSAQSFISMSDKLMVGVFVVNYNGEIIQANPKAQEILECKYNKCVGTHIDELISSVRPITPHSENISLTKQFFENLSGCIFNNACNAESCMLNLCTLKQDVEQLVQINSPFLLGERYMKFTFSVIDNKPEELDDIAYVVIFRPSKLASEDTPTRRATD